MFSISLIKFVNFYLTSLVELLEEKGIIKEQDWENRIKDKIEHKKGKSYRNIQFQSK